MQTAKMYAKDSTYVKQDVCQPSQNWGVARKLWSLDM